MTALGLTAATLGAGVGCEVGAQSRATDEGGTGSTAATTSTTSVPVISEPQGDVLENGRHFVFITALAPAGAGYSVEFDLAQWFSGDAADAAAVEDGVIPAGQQVENDYYIRNLSDRRRAMPLAGDASTQVVDWDNNCCALMPSTVDALVARGFASGRDAFWVTAADGAIVALEEQYRP